MAEEKAELFRKTCEIWNDGDLDSWLRLYDPEVEFLASGYFPDLAPTYRGHDGLRQFWAEMQAPWEWFRIEPGRIDASEHAAAGAVRFHAQGKGSGVITDRQFAFAARFRGDRVVKLSAHMTFEDALDAAGLSE